MFNFKKLKNNIKDCRKESLAVTVMFLTVILAGALYLFFAPEKSFSEDENRALEPLPQISLESVRGGSFMQSMEDWAGDHFPLREKLVSLNTAAELFSGRRDLASDYSKVPAEGGVYFGKNGHIYEVLLPDTQGVFKANADALNYFAEKYGMPLYVLAVPSGSQEQTENLPGFAPNFDQRTELDTLKASAGKNTHVIDAFSKLSLKTGNDYYFKTDHHWTTYGAYAGYSSLVNAMGERQFPQSNFTYRTISKPFYGTLYSKAVWSGCTPDKFILPYYKGSLNITQQVLDKTYKGLYREEYLDKKDKYSVYLGGNQAVTVIRNPSASGGKLLVIKDSFANSMMPYLELNFSEIHVIDLRYYNKDIYEYIKQNGIKKAAAIYSLKQLSEVSIANKLYR